MVKKEKNSICICDIENYETAEIIENTIFS